VPHGLLLQCKGGDLQAFEELCTAVQPDLFAFILSILCDHDDAADVCQECLVRVYRSLPKLRELEKFPGWIMRMAANQCNTALSRPSARIAYLEDMEAKVDALERVSAAAAPVDPRAASAGREMRAHLDAAIRKLPPRQRAAVILFEIEQLSVREVSEILGCSVGTVKFNLHEARKKLREELAKLENLPHAAVESAP